MNVIVFGCGGVGLTAKEKLEDDGMTVIAFTDNNEKKWGAFVEECIVIPPREIGTCAFDYVAIAMFKNVSVIREQLRALNVPEDKIIIPIKPKNTIFRRPVNDTREELIVLSKDNYESTSNKKYEKMHITVDDKLFLEKLEELKRVLLENNIPREKVCVVKGSVMIAYGLRASKKYEDIDIIMTDDLRELYGRGNVAVSENIEMVAVGYMNGRDDDEIINDVNKHFIFSGLKFMNLEDFYEYKREILMIKPKKLGLKDDLKIVMDFLEERAEDFADIPKEDFLYPVQPKQKLFVNPVKYSKEELVGLPKCSCESRETKRYEKMQIVVKDQVFRSKLEKLKQLLLDYNIPREKVCVVRGSVMVAYGLRELRESEAIDIIMTEDLRRLYGRGYMKLSDDAVMSAVYYMNGRDEDEIIRNPEKHFVFQGLKFMNLEDVYAFKREVRLLKTSKPEVIEDVATLKAFFKTNPKNEEA